MLITSVEINILKDDTNLNRRPRWLQRIGRIGDRSDRKNRKVRKDRKVRNDMSEILC